MEDRLRRVESDLAVLKRDCDDVKSDMSEIRRFQTTVNTFMDTFNATQEANERAQQERHRSNSAKLNVIGVIVGIGTAVILALTAYVAYNQAHHARVQPLVTHQTEQKQLAQLPLISKEE